MEISKAVQEEIIVVQNKLKNAIRDHQICIGKLKNDPNNARILTRVRDIQFYIIALGKCQKQMVQRLRKEVEAFKAQNTNGPLISLASLIGLDNNNDHIVDNNNEKKSKEDGESEVIKFSKEDYEEVVKNGDVSPPITQENAPSKDRSSSVETISGEDEVIEVSMDENSNEMQEDAEKETKDKGVEQVTFLSNLGLVTAAKFAELQNRRVERKRRSTANPQFVYTCYDVPTKRKRCAYLQSGGNAIQTRQATARMNGESSPPLVKSTLSKSTSPPTKTVPKSQIVPVQKAMTRPNILRSTSESKVFAGKVKIENGGSSVQAPLSVSKVIQSSNSRTVHIPGLPSSLTIERIENDSVVCISCRNPGILIICEHCSAKYHISCHTISPAPPRTCPKCAMVNNEVVNEEEEEEEEEEDVNKGSFNKSAELEKKERERYELREQNSDLRLQVYELEKRSQLLGQSLELQQRTRQELLGKQEKTQRSIKRMVDFIKLMQLRTDICSPPHSGSDSSRPRPSSSRSPQVPRQQQQQQSQQQQQQQVTQQQRSTQPQETTMISQNRKTATYPALQSSSTTCQDRTSPTSNQTAPTRTHYRSPVLSRRNINHTSSSRKSQIRLEGQQQNQQSQHHQQRQQQQQQQQQPKSKGSPRSTTPNCQALLVTPVSTATNQKVTSSAICPSSTITAVPRQQQQLSPQGQQLSSVQEQQQLPREQQQSPQEHHQRLVGIAESPCTTFAHCPRSLESSIPKKSQAAKRTEATSTMAKSPESNTRELSSVSSCDQPQNLRNTCCPVTALPPSPTTNSSNSSSVIISSNSSSQSQVIIPTNHRIRSSPIITSVPCKNLERMVSSTRCSQAVTSPVSSPIVQSSQEQFTRHHPQCLSKTTSSTTTNTLTNSNNSRSSSNSIHSSNSRISTWIHQSNSAQTNAASQSSSNT